MIKTSVRYLLLQQATKTLKKFFRESGYANRDEDNQYLEKEMNEANARLVYLRAKKDEIDRLKDLLKSEQLHNLKLKAQRWEN